MRASFEKQLERLLSQAEGWTPEETANAAGALLDYAGVSRDTFIAFLEPLEETNREELALQFANMEEAG